MTNSTQTTDIKQDHFKKTHALSFFHQRELFNISEAQ